MIDAVARAVGREPADVRIDNMVPPRAMPYRSATHKFYDSGDYPECARRAAPPSMWRRFATRQQRGEADGRTDRLRARELHRAVRSRHRRMGRARPSRRIRIRARARAPHCRTASWFCSSASRTTARGWRPRSRRSRPGARIAVADVVVRHGDSAVSPYGMGTFASRSMTMAGGAVSQRLRPAGREN